MTYEEWQDEIDEAVQFRDWTSVDYLYKDYPEFANRAAEEFTNRDQGLTDD